MFRKKMLIILVCLVAMDVPVQAEDLELSVRNDSTVSGLEITGARVDTDNIEKYYPEKGKAYTVNKTNVRKEPNGQVVKTLDPGAEVVILDYSDDWAKTKDGYIYAGLLTPEYDGERQIHANDAESMKYEGLAYSYLTDLPEPVAKLAEETPAYLQASKDAIKERDDSFSDATSGYTEFYPDHTAITVWANTVCMKNSLLHELGHVYDHELLPAGQYSNTKEWQLVCQEEADAVCKEVSKNSHNCENAEEYFAESVKLYIIDNNALKEWAPKTYDIMKGLLGE